MDGPERDLFRQWCADRSFGRPGTGSGNLRRNRALGPDERISVVAAGAFCAGGDDGVASAGGEWQWARDCVVADISATCGHCSRWKFCGFKPATVLSQQPHPDCKIG